MTTIDRLGLRGVRSYGTDEETFIKFFKPLTIILGRNGSGKSSIIEAVKMATTGDMPPNADRGAAFVHDPRIHNETETKAKVRLMFTNVRGDQYIVSRHFQLSIKKGPRGVGYKTEFKTLDQTVKRMDGDSASSYRCSDLNALLPDIMRVTKPVLNNVIFVHQEDSLWPLSDPKKLKEKFDEIFAATRYTKALDTIRKYRRDQNVELRVVNTELLHFEEKVKILEKVRSQVDEILIKNDKLKKGIQVLDEELAVLNAEKSEAEAIASEHETHTKKLDRLKTERDIIEKDKAFKFSEMETYLPDLIDSEIETEIKQLETALDRVSGERSKRAEKRDLLSRDIDLKRTELNRRQSRRGMLEQQTKTHSERIARLEEMKGEFLHENPFSSAADNSDIPALPSVPDNIEIWTEALEALNVYADENVKKVTKYGEKRIDEASQHLNGLKSKLRELKLESDRKSEEISQKRSQISNIRDELRTMDDSESSVKEAESRLEEMDRLFKEKSNNTKISELEDQITKDRKDVSTLREDLRSLRRTKDKLSEFQNEHARYDMCREEVGKRKKNVESLLEDFVEIASTAVSELKESGDAERLEEVRDDLGFEEELSSNNADDWKERVQSSSALLMERKENLLQGAERRHGELAASLKSIEARRDEQKAEVSGLKKELKTVLRAIRNEAKTIPKVPDCKVNVEHVTSLFKDVHISSESGHAEAKKEQVESVRKTVDDMDLEVVKANQRITQLETGRLFAQMDLEAFENDPQHKCPACGQSSSRKTPDMRKNLEERVEKMKDPRTLQKARSTLEDLRRSASGVKKIHAIGMRTCNLLENFDAANEKLKEVESELRTLRQKASDAESALESLKERLGDDSASQQIEGKRVELLQSFTDLQRTWRQAESLKTQLSSTMTDSRSLGDVEEETIELEDRIQKLQDKIDMDLRTMDREQKELRRAENRFHHAKQKSLELQTMAEKHKRLKAEKKQLTTSIRTNETEIEDLREKMKSLQSDAEFAEEEFVMVRAETNAEVRKANDRLSSSTMFLQSWKGLLREVQAFEQSGKEKELEKLEEALKRIQSEIDTHAEDVRAIDQEQQTVSDSQKNMASKIRNLKDNLKYRVQESRLRDIASTARKVEDELALLERRAGGNPHENVVDLNKQINTNNESRAATNGLRQACTESYKEKRKELRELERQGSRRMYDECRIRKQTMELASSDLEKYHRALDQALMAFHTLKMNSINRTIKELWQQTYRGTDIDDIEIISDHSDPRTVTATTLKRSFNYRVSMRQGQATLDMRGRCSAGQKVLACLVIRLALAESFCTDCGILALDEPTTNLDRENIESLAVALKTIIETRRKQRNFQLILITHDQDFIDMIGARDFCSEYFMIFKDMQGISRARVQDMQEI